jgi:hypothetical protein
MSIIGHLLLLILLMLLHIDLSVNEDFVEVSFLASSARTPEPARVVQPAAAMQRTVSPPRQEQQPAEALPLPKRRMLEVEDPELQTARRRDIAATTEPALLNESAIRGSSDQREAIPLPGRNGADTREAAGSRPMAAGDKVLAPLGASNPGGVGQPEFDIQWTGTPREKVSGALPNYPEGANENRVIRLSFLVSPTGEVLNPIPVQKGDAQMENEAIRALKSWRFNALGSSAPQVMQRGIIAFQFRVR